MNIADIKVYSNTRFKKSENLYGTDCIEGQSAVHFYFMIKGKNYEKMHRKHRKIISIRHLPYL